MRPDRQGEHEAIGRHVGDEPRGEVGRCARRTQSQLAMTARGRSSAVGGRRV